MDIYSKMKLQIFEACHNELISESARDELLVALEMANMDSFFESKDITIRLPDARDLDNFGYREVHGHDKPIGYDAARAIGYAIANDGAEQSDSSKVFSHINGTNDAYAQLGGQVIGGIGITLAAIGSLVAICNAIKSAIKSGEDKTARENLAYYEDLATINNELKDSRDRLMKAQGNVNRLAEKYKAEMKIAKKENDIEALTKAKEIKADLNVEKKALKDEIKSVMKTKEKFMKVLKSKNAYKHADKFRNELDHTFARLNATEEKLGAL